MVSIALKMSEFKVLRSNQRFISSILRVDVEPQQNQSIKFTNKFFESIPVFLVLFTLFSVLISCAVRIFYESYDFAVKLTAAIGFIALCQAITIFLSLGVNFEMITTLYQTLQAIVDGDGTESFFVCCI